MIHLEVGSQCDGCLVAVEAAGAAVEGIERFAGHLPPDCSHLSFEGFAVGDGLGEFEVGVEGTFVLALKGAEFGHGDVVKGVTLGHGFWMHGKVAIHSSWGRLVEGLIVALHCDCRQRSLVGRRDDVCDVDIVKVLFGKRLNEKFRSMARWVVDRYTGADEVNVVL